MRINKDFVLSDALNMVKTFNLPRKALEHHDSSEDVNGSYKARQKSERGRYRKKERGIEYNRFESFSDIILSRIFCTTVLFLMKFLNEFCVPNTMSS